MAKTFFAVHCFEVIPCHLVAPKDRDASGKYAANSKRDNRRFATAYETKEEAMAKVIEYENKLATNF